MPACELWRSRLPARDRRPGEWRGAIGLCRSPGTDIKALSAEQIDDLLNGRGMGLALAAELNGYPGPRHVLELADELALTPAQLARTRALFQAMRLRAIALGEQILAREALLDELFAAGTATADTLHQTTAALGRLSGQLRAHHLGYHLAMRDLLDPHQIEEYRRLRGYAAPQEAAAGHLTVAARTACSSSAAVVRVCSTQGGS